MIEDLAVQYMLRDEEELQAIGLAVAICGAIVAAIFGRSTWEIARAPYFAYSALIFFALSVLQAIWLQSPDAAQGGYLWVLTAITLAAILAAGFFFCRISTARSRDAYGHGGMAFLGFIPIANFWLLLTRSKTEASPNRAPTVPLLTGGVGVVFGFALLIAGLGATLLIDRESARIAQDPDAQKTWIDLMIRTHGLEDTLRQIAAETPTPVVIDHMTTITRLETDGSQLRRIYVVTLEDAPVSVELRERATKAICDVSAFAPIFTAGGSIQEVYTRTDGSHSGTLTVTRTECGL